MTRDETKQLLASIKAVYPAFHKDQYGKEKSDFEWKATINAWHMVLEKYDIGFISQGVKKLFEENKFPQVTPAQVVELSKECAMGYMRVVSCEQLGVKIPPETWLNINGTVMRYGKWNEGRRALSGQKRTQIHE